MVVASPTEIANLFWNKMNTNVWEDAAALFHPEFELTWPQSGEVIRGRENFVAMNANYPAAGMWHFTVNRIVGDETQAVTDVSVTDSARHDRVVSFFEIRNGLIWRVTEFWPDPFEAAAWRAPWVEKAP